MKKALLLLLLLTLSCSDDDCDCKGEFEVEHEDTIITFEVDDVDCETGWPVAGLKNFGIYTNEYSEEVDFIGCID